jgi:hypothetical protein
MKKIFTKILNFVSRPIINYIGELLDKKISSQNKESDINQLNLLLQYKILYHHNSVSLLNFKDIGFQKYSQHEEDGILLFIFALIGTTNKKCVEMCAGDGLECNTTNLILSHRWIGALFDGNKANVERGIEFFKKHPDTMYWPPRFTHSWITKDNINQLIKDSGFEGNIDLFSLDIDGNDYWLLKELSVIKPRVIVLEINHLWGDREAVSVPYDDNFKAEFTEYGSDYAGASLPAFVKLCKEKGYRLVGTNAIATNAFFVRNDIEHAWLPEIDASKCFQHPRAQFGIKERYLKIKDKSWINV